MKQVTHILKDGRLDVSDVPVPTLTDRFVLVRTTASVISAGTEKTKIDMGKKSLIQKARARPDLVKQVIKKLRTEGLAKTINTVNSRLTSAAPLGYSSAGIALAVGGLVEGIRPGDRVACGGVGYANHAEFAVVPKNLVVRVPDRVSDEEASFATLGAIALQGIRLADPKLGEVVLVLGLGLLGQMAVQMLRANGCQVLGTDLDPSLVALSETWGATGLPVGDVENLCREITGGIGVDAVLICAGTSSNEPIELCGRITRQKGRVVVVGAVRMDIPREDYFRKEISVVISRSYGPGRYDPTYEEAGQDYPVGYVRFTEQRNMATVLQLIRDGQLNVKRLITHRFPVDEAVAAYGLIEGTKREPYLGIVLQYEAPHSIPSSEPIVLDARPIDKARIGVSMIGAGNYATASLLPPLKDNASVAFRGLMTASGRTAASVAKQFGFTFCGSAVNDVLDDQTDAVIIATRHNSHASLAAQALQAGKHVFVEKPIALSMEELGLVARAAALSPDRHLQVGFNRRYAPLTREVLAHFAGASAPRVIAIRINAGFIPTDHWIQDPAVGGGRLLGEACHFIDLASALAEASPTKVYAQGVLKPGACALLNDNLVITLNFASGSIASIVYAADGSKAQPKERVEVFGGGRSAVIEDFRTADLFEGDTTVRTVKGGIQDKGQRSMLAGWIAGIKSGQAQTPISTTFAVSAATIAAVESLTLGTPVDVPSAASLLPLASDEPVAVPH